MRLFIAILLCGIGMSAQAQWTQLDKIVASDRESGNFYGNAVAISGNYAIAGAYYENEDVAGNNTLNYAGVAYIDEKNAVGNWIEVQKIVASDRSTNDLFGFSVAISGNYLLVGAKDEDEDGAGMNMVQNAGWVHLEIVNAHGQIVLSRREFLPTGRHSLQFDMNHLSQGFYLLRNTSRQGGSKSFTKE